MQAPGRDEPALMRVAVDATPLLGEQTGVGAFCVGAFGALSRRADLDLSAFAISWRRRHELESLLPAHVRHAQRAMPARPLHLAWSHARLPAVESFIGAVDVVHGTNYVVPPTRHAARVVTVHDLTSLRFPELCDAASLQFPRLVRRAVDDGAWVHTPSQFVADEVVADLGIDASRVRAVHHGIPELAHGGAGSSVLAKAPRYVLAVGTVEPRKDYPTLVRAFDAVSGKLEDTMLVIAGGEGWGVRGLDEALSASRRPERVVRLGYVAGADLGDLLAGASVVAYPSVYEGFGLVPLEAMAAGVPVVATAVGAIPEVVGDAALLVPHGDVDALGDAILRSVCDEETRSILVERGRARAAKFTWEGCAQGLVDLYFSSMAAL